MYGVIVGCIIIFLLFKWFMWKLYAVTLLHFMVVNNIEITKEQLQKHREAVILHWLNLDKKVR